MEKTPPEFRHVHQRQTLFLEQIYIFPSAELKDQRQLYNVGNQHCLKNKALFPRTQRSDPSSSDENICISARSASFSAAVSVYTLENTQRQTLIYNFVLGPAQSSCQKSCAVFTKPHHICFSMLSLIHTVLTEPWKN